REKELRRQVALLGKLGVVEGLVGRLEIGAAVLPIGVEEQGIELAVEVVVVRDIASRPRPRIELQPATIKVANEPLWPREERWLPVASLAKNDGQHVGDRALFDSQAAVHVGFAELHLGIEQNAALGRVRLEANCNRLAGTIAERKARPACAGEPQRSCAN